MSGYPADLIEQARALLTKGTSGRVRAGAPRQADLRRAVSNAYYAVFHALIAAAVDRAAGVTAPKEFRQAVARTYSHADLRAASEEVKKANLTAKYAPLFLGCSRPGGLQKVAESVLSLQKRRHAADYDLGERLLLEGAVDAVAEAEATLQRMEALKGDEAFRRYLFALQAHQSLRA